jgi:acetyl esterase/lipase
MHSMIRAAALLFASALLPSCAPVDALNATVSSDGVSVQRDIAFGDDPRQRLDVYRPRAAAAPLPLVVFIYGGAWKSGSKSDYKFVAAPLARQGVVVAVADYRLVPQVRFPTFLEDNARAVAFARAHAAEWGADPHRLFLIGHSAGAYDVLMLAVDPQYLAAMGLDRASLAGVVTLAAPTDFLPLDDQDTIAAFGQVKDLESTQPVHFADGHGPPLLLLHGQADDTIYPRNSTVMVAKVRADGGNVTLKTYPGLGHIGIVTSFAPLFGGRAPVMADVMDFIRAHPAL